MKTNKINLDFFSDSKKALKSVTLPPFNLFFICYSLRDHHVENKNSTNAGN